MGESMSARPSMETPPRVEHDIDWRQAVQEVVWIPSEYRVPTMSAPAARRGLRCTEASFAQLIDLGLPSTNGPDGLLFDLDDLKNVGLYSRSRVTDVELGMRLILAFMEAGRNELTKPRRWSYRLQLISTADPSERVIRRVYRPMPEIWGGELESFAASEGPPAEVAGPFFRMAQGSEVTGALTTRGAEQVVQAAGIRRIVTEFLDSGVRWHYLPAAFAADPLQPTSLGAGNCRTLCTVLCQRLTDAGFEARCNHGWMIAISEVGHGWVDVVDDDGKIKCLDPSFALLATQNGFGPPDFRDFVMGSILNRVVPTRAPLNGPLAIDDGGEDVVAFMCRADEQPNKRGPGPRWRRSAP